MHAEWKRSWYSIFADFVWNRRELNMTKTPTKEEKKLQICVMKHLQWLWKSQRDREREISKRIWNVLTTASVAHISSMSNTCLCSSYMVSISLFYYGDLNKHKYLSIDFSFSLSFHSFVRACARAKWFYRMQLTN